MMRVRRRFKKKGTSLTRSFFLEHASMEKHGISPEIAKHRGKRQLEQFSKSEVNYAGKHKFARM